MVQAAYQRLAVAKALILQASGEVLMAAQMRLAKKVRPKRHHDTPLHKLLSWLDASELHGHAALIVFLNGLIEGRNDTLQKGEYHE